MKAILITQDLKNNNKEFFINNNVGDIVQKSLPIRFHGVENILGDYRTRNDLHLLDGWKDVVIPPVNNAIEKQGNELILSGNVYTYAVIDLTEAEIVDRILNEAEIARQTKIQEEQIKIVDEKFQAIEDDNEALANQDIYPAWNPNGQEYNPPFRCKHFNDENELVLYRCIQTIVSQPQFPPRLIPAHFVLVFEPSTGNEYEVWSERTGANAIEYSIGKIVWYPDTNGQLWISKINSNTTVPDGDIPFNRYWELYTP